MPPPCSVCTDGGIKWGKNHRGISKTKSRTRIVIFFLPRNVFLRFCIVYCSRGNREHPARYLKQYKNAGKRFRVYGAEERVI